MLQIVKTNQNGITEQIETFEKGSWLNIVAPNRETLLNVSSHYNIPIEFLEDSLDLEEGARVEYDEETRATLIINDFPIIDVNNKQFESYITVPIGIIIGPDYIVTIGHHPLPFPASFLKRQTTTKMKTRLALEMLFIISSQYITKLKLLNKQRLKIESNLRNSLTNKQLYDLMEIEKSLVYFLTSLTANAEVIDRLFRTNSVKLYEEDTSLLEDVRIENNQAIGTTQLYSSIVSSITTSYASLISNGLNKTMKTLTLFTVFLTLPTLVFSFFGMNVELPVAESNPYSFLIIICIALLFVLWVSITLARRGIFKK